MKRYGFVFLLLLCALSLRAQNYADLTFKMAVFGPSDKIFVWWGHAALIVENTRWNSSRVFDWGIFSYPSDNFLHDFVNDRVRYKCRAGPYDLKEYLDEDRDIIVYTLNLDTAGKEAILTYAENKVLPENCYYDYHEFRNNCSTGIRDIIDMGTGGQLKAWANAAAGRFSLRQQARRFTWHSPFSDWFLDFLMGQSLDGPLTLWDEMFLPVEIARNIDGFRFTDNSGAERKLVSSVQILNSTKTRNPILQAPLSRFLPSLVSGVFAAVLFALIAGARKKFPRAGGITWGISQSLAGLILGAAGCVLFFGRFFLNNDYIRQNYNLLFINPLLLAAVPLGIIAAVRKPKTEQGGRGGCSLAEKALRILWTYVFIACALTVLMKALPVFYQRNGSVQALVLPLAFALSNMPRICGGMGRRLSGRIFKAAVLPPLFGGSAGTNM
ncbi:MAG: DUF4105 domain-containing protein [Spirochaetales bacterium]|nr:DUF4105 domain-containing protein [Spirochaetales bacterium]